MTHTNNNYYDHHASRFHSQWLKEKSSADLLPFIELLEQGARVLDLGCGNGIDLACLSKAGFEGTGVDSSPAMVSLARRIHERSGVEILEKNFLFLNLQEGEWDGVWANLSFCELAPEVLQRLLAICFKGVRVGGAIGAILYEGTGSFEEATLGDSTNSAMAPSRKIHLYSEKALCSMFEQTGFQVLKVGRQSSGGNSIASQFNVGSADAMPKILILAKRV